MVSKADSSEQQPGLSQADGVLEIRLHNGQSQFKTGELVMGRLKMFSESEMEATELVIGMSGSETTNFRINDAD